MDDNLKLIKKEILKYQDTLVIFFDEVVMLRGWMEDTNPEWGDYFYIYEEFGPLSKYGAYSCVGNFIPLKDQLKSKDYKELIRLFELNRMPQFLKEIEYNREK